ncbi:MAG TPA: aldo/keto reductase [Anaeromyxobacteraceae bacterium]|nr:aldo/keto reductase [Anaeromyxobacteraceae bacterium]
MERVTIPGIPFPVSRIGLGTWAIGGWMWGGTDEPESIRTLERALELGVNLVDTAPVYGFGRAEEIVGRAIGGGARREAVAIATKCGLSWRDGKVYRDSSRARVRQEVEDSLRRLRTGWIDLCQVHWPDPAVPLEETADELAKLREEGKIRAIGVSNFSPAQMERFAARAPLATAQPPYNLFERAIERDVLPWCREHGVATLAYGALCRGLLSGRMTEDTRFLGDDLRRYDPKFRQPRLGQYLAAAQALRELADAELGRPLVELAVRWLLDQPGVSIALWGARRPEQLEAIPRILALWRLTPELLGRIDEILEAHVRNAVGPEFMAPP